MVDFVQGDTAPSVFGALTHSDGSVFDLTAATAVRFQMRLSIDRRFTVDAVAVTVVAATGHVRYDWVAGDLAAAGTYLARWLVEWGDGTLEHTNPANDLTISVQ